MIENFENTTQDVGQTVLQKSEMKQKRVTVSLPQKIDLPIMSF